jgi:dTDP-glucose pyrophosphorylase
MLPVVDRPILHHVLDNARSMGVFEIILVVGESRPLIEKYFADGKDFGVTIRYIDQASPRGIAHAVGLLDSLVHGPFLVFLGDDMTLATNLGGMDRYFRTRGAGAVEAVVYEEDVETLRRTCCVNMDSFGKILDLVEKPTDPTSKIRGCGIYLFDPMVFDYINKTIQSPIRKEVEITDTLRLMALDGLAYGFRIEGTNVNVNTVSDLMRAVKLLLLQQPAITRAA